MPFQSWTGCLNGSTNWSGAGTALSTATTATLSPTPGTLDVPIQAGGQPYGWYAGMLLAITARGFITTTATSTTATWLLASRVGNTGSTYITLATTSGLTTSTTVLTGVQWRLEATVRCTAVASSGNTISTQGELYLMGVSTTPTAAPNPVLWTGIQSLAGMMPMPATSGETAAAVDTTQLQGLSLRGTLAGANATIQLTQWTVLALD